MVNYTVQSQLGIILNDSVNVTKINYVGALLIIILFSISVYFLSQFLLEWLNNIAKNTTTKVKQRCNIVKTIVSIVIALVWLLSSHLYFLAITFIVLLYLSANFINSLFNNLNWRNGLIVGILLTSLFILIILVHFNVFDFRSELKSIMSYLAI